jgi:hypothetical protein
MLPVVTIEDTVKILENVQDYVLIKVLSITVSIVNSQQVGCQDVQYQANSKVCVVG